MKLNSQQDELVRALQGARATYDKKLTAIDMNYIASKEAAKQPIRDLVQAAEAAGVPKRQMHLALGFAQVSSLRAFLMPSAKVGASSFYAGSPDAVSTEFGTVFEVPDEIEFRYDKQIMYWFEAGVEKKIERRAMGQHTDGRNIFKYNTPVFHKQTPAVQEALLHYGMNDINLLTADEYKALTTEGILPRWDNA